jgi:hypothetical protein
MVNMPEGEGRGNAMDYEAIEKHRSRRDDEGHSFGGRGGLTPADWACIRLHTSL